jgi:hypothetical protein
VCDGLLQQELFKCCACKLAAIVSTNTHDLAYVGSVGEVPAESVSYGL